MAYRTLGQQPGRDLEGRVLRSVERWRAMRPDAMHCLWATRLLNQLGSVDRAWEYLSTALALHPHDGESWREVAQLLARQNDFALADKLYREAALADPDDVRTREEHDRMRVRAGWKAKAAERPGTKRERLLQNRPPEPKPRGPIG